MENKTLSKKIQKYEGRSRKEVESHALWLKTTQTYYFYYPAGQNLTPVSLGSNKSVSWSCFISGGYMSPSPFLAAPFSKRKHSPSSDSKLPCLWHFCFFMYVWVYLGKPLLRTCMIRSSAPHSADHPLYMKVSWVPALIASATWSPIYGYSNIFMYSPIQGWEQASLLLWYSTRGHHHVSL